MNEGTEARYTDGRYLDANPTWHEEDSQWKAGQIRKMLARHDLRPGSVCELGCGAGGILSELCDTLPPDISFTGFDISPQAYRLAMPKAHDRLHFHCGDFLLDDRHFDLLLVIDVFEHVEDYIGFLRKIRDRATYKLFHIPLDISVQRVLLAKPILRRRRELGHLHYFTKETALATLEDLGYEIRDWFYTPGSIQLAAGSPLYALGRWPLRLARRLNEDLTARILGGHSLMVLTR